MPEQPISEAISSHLTECQCSDDEDLCILDAKIDTQGDGFQKTTTSEPEPDKADLNSCDDELSVEERFYRKLGPERFRQFHERDFHDGHWRTLSSDQSTGEMALESDYSNHETDFHTRHHGVRQNNLEIDGDKYPIESVAELEFLRRHYSTEYRTLMAGISDETRRGILACIVQKRGPVTYDELTDWTTTTKRTVKNHVFNLRDQRILEIEEGRPSTVAFTNDDLRLLASDALSFENNC